MKESLVGQAAGDNDEPAGRSSQCCGVEKVTVTPRRVTPVSVAVAAEIKSRR